MNGNEYSGPQVHDASLAALGAAWFEGMTGGVEPAAGNVLETHLGVLGVREVADLLAEFGLATLGELAVGSPFDRTTTRTAKLLASRFQQPVISARRFESAEILTDFVKDQRGWFPGVIERV
jgi:hypothetical protein